MFVETLRVHWKTLRWGLAALTVAAFAVPLVWVGPAAVVFEGLSPDVAARFWIRGGLPGDASELFPALALATGVLIALGVWYRDHAGDHVLALSLPVSRPRYVLVKFGAGFLLILPVAAALLLGSLVAVAGIQLPDWLHAYPGRLALRFLLATSTVYALGFALAAGTIPTATKVLIAVGVITVLLPALPLLLGTGAGQLMLRVAEVAYDVVYESVGPFSLLVGDWSLFGV